MKISITVEGLSLDEAVMFLAAPADAQGVGVVPAPRKVDTESVAEVAKAALPKGRVPPTPAVQKLIDKTGVDWKDIEGTGKEGRITQQDVKVYVREMQKERAAPSREKEVIVPKNDAIVPDSVNSGDKSPSGIEVTKYALDDVRDALKALNKAEGMEACLKLLGKYGVKKIGDLKETDYAAFIADATQ